MRSVVLNGLRRLLIYQSNRHAKPRSGRAFRPVRWCYLDDKIARSIPRAERQLPMALTDDEVVAVLRLKEEQERILSERTDWIRTAQEAADRVRDFIDPPALRRMREVQEQLMAIVDPPYLREMREAEERLRDMIDPPALRQWREEHDRMQQLSAVALAELQPAIDRGIFEIDTAKHLAERYLADMPIDHMAGL